VDGDIVVIAQEAVVAAAVDGGGGAIGGGGVGEGAGERAVVGAIVLFVVLVGDVDAGGRIEAEGEGRGDAPGVFLGDVAAGDATVLPEGVEAEGGAFDGGVEGLVDVEGGAVAFDRGV